MSNKSRQQRQPSRPAQAEKRLRPGLSYALYDDGCVEMRTVSDSGAWLSVEIDIDQFSELVDGLKLALAEARAKAVRHAAGAPKHSAGQPRPGSTGMLS